MIKQLPISLVGARKSDVRSQFAALCYRIKDGKVQVLLITSRGSKRWIIPKGWPMDAKTPASAALQEAWEEAGVKGAAGPTCLGVFSYVKETEGKADDMPVLALVYGVRVRALLPDYPEAGQRKRKWLSRKQASKLVNEPELARIIRDFDPHVHG